jgi:hypothetical protein
MISRSRRFALPLGLVLVTMATQTEAQTDRNYRTLSTSRQIVEEEDITILVRFALGHFTLGRDQGGALYRSRLRYDEDLFEPVQRYDRERRTLEIRLEGQEGRDFKGRELKDLDQRLDMAVSPSVPARIDLEFGVVSADLDLGGISLIEVDVKTGASESVLRFSRPTTAPCERLHVVVGAAKFEAENLGNANCQTMQFEGAAGAFMLDFTGEWQHGGETAAKIKLGVGSLTVRFPAHLGVAISLDRFLATFERSGFVKRGDVFYSSNYDSAAATLRLDIDAAFGDINVVWVPR